MVWNRYQDENHAANLEEARRQAKETDMVQEEHLYGQLQATVHVRTMNINEIANQWKIKMDLECNTDQMQLVTLVHKQVLSEHKDLCTGTRVSTPISVLVTGIHPLHGCVHVCRLPPFRFVLFFVRHCEPHIIVLISSVLRWARHGKILCDEFAKRSI